MINIYKNSVIFFFILFFAFNTLAKNNFNIIINGSDYLDKDIIFSLIDNLDELTDQEIINLISKNLYKTGNFKNLEISISENDITINIIENPKINKIDFYNNERFNKNEILDLYNQMIITNTYNEIYINNFLNNLKDLYKSFGYNQIKIDYQIIDINNSNSINLDFYFDEGKISKIGKVNFIGNDFYKKSTLLEIINSKPKRDLLFFLRKNFKLFEVKQDTNRLKLFYQNSGFKDVKINYETEFISEKNKFNIIFFINEGLKYKFDKIDISFDINNFNEMESDILFDLLNSYKNKNISDNSFKKLHINNIKKILSDYIYNIGKNFYEIKVLEKSENELVSIIFEINNIIPKYVNLININGNIRTLDKVIRREIVFSEGDPINNEMISESISNINKLGFFQNVEINEDYLDNNLVNINIELEERSSGNFNIGLAFGTLEGATFIASLNQKNISGTGRGINLALNTSDKNTLYSFNIKEPRIYKKINLTYGLSYQEIDFSKSSYYNLDKFNADLGFEFEITNQIRNNIKLIYELNNYDITNTSNVSSSILNSSGRNAIIKFKNDLYYNNLDSFIRPKNGDSLNLSSIYSPITNSDDGYLKNIIILKKYKSFDKYILSMQAKLGNITSLQDDIISDNDKFSLGGYWLRGFDTRGVGPRNSSSSYIGGNNVAVAKFDISRSLLSNSDNPLDFYLFTDLGTVYGNKTTPTNANESLRSSAGYGLKFYSPIGPIGLSWGYVLESESYDKKREFLFSIGNLN